MIDRAIVLHTLLCLGPLSVQEARVICGWPMEDFANAVADGFERGIVCAAKHRQSGRMINIGAPANARAKTLRRWAK